MGQFEKPDALFKVGLVGTLVPADLPQATILLLAPVGGQLLEKVKIDPPIELVDVDGMKSALQPVVLGLQPRHCGIVFLLFVDVAFTKRRRKPCQDRVVERQTAEKCGELLLQHLLADIRFGAFPLVAAAMIIDITALLFLSDQRAAAMAALDQAGEGKVALRRLDLAGIAAIEDALHPLPQFAADERLVAALVEMAVPFELAGVEPVAQDGVDAADRHGRTCLLVDEASAPGLVGGLFKRHRASRIPTEEMGDDAGNARVGRYGFLAVRAGHVEIAKRRLGRPDTLLGFFLLSFARFLGQVVDVVFGHQHLDAMHEFFRRTGIAREDDAFLDKMDLDIELIEGHPVAQVAVEPIGFLDQKNAYGRMRLKVTHHLLEARASGVLGGLDIGVFVSDGGFRRLRIIL